MNTPDNWLVNIIDRVAARITHTQHPIIEDDILDILERNIELAYPILDALLTHSGNNRDEPSPNEQACLLLICEILAFVHYAIEQDRIWANDFSEEFQHYLAEHAFKPHINGSTLQHLLDILQQTDVEIIDAIRDANARLIEATHITDIPHESDDISILLEEIVDIGDGSVYELYENLVGQTHKIVPLEVQLIMVSEMLRSHVQLVRDASVLMLLHPEVLIRRHIGIDLLNHIEVISPQSLRRLIVMRNWLPSNERQVIDKLIRNARLKGVQCEPWPDSEVLKIIATGFDGIGAQSILVLTKQNNYYHLAGVLLKETLGIREPLLFHSKKKSELNRVIKEMSYEAPVLNVELEYLNQVVPLFLQINLLHSKPPSPILLGLAELVGLSEWRPEQKSDEDIINELIDEAPSDCFEENAINKLLKRSKTWLDKKNFAKSWFEHDAEVDNALEKIIIYEKLTPPVCVETLAETVCEKILEPRREKWTRRLLMMALWAKHNTKSSPKWEEFFMLAKLIKDGMPLTKIPLMRAIAAETVFISAKDYIQE